MIYFRALGALSLLDSGEREIESVLRRPKYLALLAYFVVARPGGFHRRDTLVSLFWPELDQLHARSALRQAVHYLRRTLGNGVIVARGEEELSVDVEALWSDAVEFAKSVKAKDASAPMLELYRGDFLPGFHVSGAPEFERWLEEERDRLRRQAADMASRLADAEERKGSLMAAIRWSRRAVELSSEQEDKARRLIELLGRAGDREGALRAYDDLRRRLAKELEVEPSPQTDALVQDIRSRSMQTPIAPAIAEPAERPTPPESERVRQDTWRDESLPLPQPRDGPAVRPVVFIAALVFTIALAGGWIAWRRPSSSDRIVAARDSIPTLANVGTRVAVFPFRVQGNPELQYLGEGLAELVGEAIDGVGEWRRVNPAALMNLLHQQNGNGARNQERASSAASSLGARHYVLGNIVAGASRLVFSASLFEVASSEPLAEASLEADAEGLAAAANQLTWSLLTNVSVGEGPRLARVGAVRTNNFQALKAYLQGEALLRRARYDSAVTKLREAVAADSTFAVAWYRLGLAYSLTQSMGHEGDNHASLTKAMRYRDDLSPRDRLLVSGWYAHFHGRPGVAERMARQIIGGDPEDAEAWHLLGLTRMWYAWQHGRPYLEARTALERALAIDPRFPDAIIHAYWAAILEARYGYADSLFQVAPIGLATGGWGNAARGLFAFVRGGRRAQDIYTRSLETIDDQNLLASAWTLASHSDSVAAARRWLARFAGSTERSDWGRASGQIFLAHLEAARGRWNEAQALFRRAARFDDATALSSYAWLAAMPFFERPIAELSAIRDSLRDWEPPLVPRDAGRPYPQTLPEVLTIPDELRPWARDYLLGLLSVRLRDRVEAERHAARLDAAAEPRDRIGLRHDLALEIRASLALTDGKPQVALQLLDGASMTVAHSNQVWYSPYYSRPLGRFLRAEALRLLGRDDEALGWYGTIGEKYGTEFVYRAPVFLRQAQIHERRGNAQQAFEYYRRFSARWRDADPEYQPLVRDADARMRRLLLKTSLGSTLDARR
jgi:DNA-binding SARP family transcriptional activator